MADTFATSSDYTAWLAAIKSRIQAAQISAARAVNRDLILLYWDIGREIVEKQHALDWGDAVVNQLASDLRKSFPSVHGFSKQNVWRMRQLYLTYTSPEFLSQAVRELEHAEATAFPRGRSQRSGEIEAVPTGGLSRKKTDKQALKPTVTENLSRAVRDLVAAVPWGHHANVLARIQDHAERLYYLRATAQFGWTRNVLLNQIKAGAYEHSLAEGKTHNFPAVLPEYLAEQAEETLKSSYSLEFLGISHEAREREIEQRLVEQVQDFILELGYGFCFIGRQHRLTLGDKEYFVDLLFYHRFLKSLVAFELKAGAFKPEYAGKMDFYLNVLNDKERAADDNPSIGIILCAEKDSLEVEFALKSKTNPIGVAEYQLQTTLPKELRGKLPTSGQLSDALRLPVRRRGRRHEL